jgi:hypothetical protein
MKCSQVRTSVTMGRSAYLRADGLKQFRPDLAHTLTVSRAPTASTMTSQGTAHGRFARAIRDRHLRRAEMAARELGGLNLAKALDLTLLMREVDRWRYERAAVRWLERFIEERNPTLAELALASASLAEVGGAGDRSLRDLLRSRETSNGKRR